MNQTLRVSTAGGLGLVLALALGGQPASAANIGNLASQYSGAWHSTTSAANEDLPSGLTVLQTNANGTFTGLLDDVSIIGKVSPKGVITFKGQVGGSTLQQPQGTSGTGAITKGKAQLSATGLFIVGTFSYKGTGGLASLTGNYIFSLAIPAAGSAGNGGLEVSANPEDFGDRYLGRAHSSTLQVTENLVFDLAVASRGSKGKFTAVLGVVPVAGKISSSGKVTFKGKATQPQGSFSATAKGQLSATGRFFLGTVQSKATGQIANQSGKFTFESTVDADQSVRAAGVKLGSAQ